MEEEKGIKDYLKEISEKVETIDKKKSKKFRIPIKGRVGRIKLKKGYVTVQQINESRGITITKVPIENGTYKLDDTTHVVEEDDILIYKGKPWIIQPKSLLNPLSVNNMPHQTYGQKYLMARMVGDALRDAKKKIKGGIIFIVVILGIVGFYLLRGQFTG